MTDDQHDETSAYTEKYLTGQRILTAKDESLISSDQGSGEGDGKGEGEPALLI